MKFKSLTISLAIAWSMLLFFSFSVPEEAGAADFGGEIELDEEKELSPYLMVTTLDGKIGDTAEKVKQALLTENFEIIGEYNPEGKANLHVIAYTRTDLQDAALKVKDRGLLAAILKIGLKETEGKVDVSMTNPEYIFRGYMLKEFEKHNAPLMKVDGDAKKAMGIVGTEFKPFGGKLSTNTLEHYHYKFGMEYFDDPVSLKKYESFEEGVATIRKNLANKVGGAFEVFSVVRNDAKVAVFGIGLSDKETGEPNFLPKIGDHHLAALPYEIILSGNEASMLHGRFRIAIHWPTLSMVFGKFSFIKIMSTPGHINDTMTLVTQ